MQFCHDTGLTPVPADNKTICRYAAYLASKLGYSSISKYMNILRLLHLESDLPNPLVENWALKSVLRGIQREKGSSPCRKLPITPNILLGIHKQLDFNQPADCLFWCTCLIAFYGLFRKSNLMPATVTAFDPSKHLTRADVFRTKSGLALRVKWSKTIQFKERAYMVPLLFLPNHTLCPVTALCTLLTMGMALPCQAPLLAFGTPFGPTMLTQPQFVKRLKQCIATLGLPATQYSSHSFRRGGATWAFSAGLPGEFIQLMGDWRSQAYRMYLELSLDFKYSLMEKFTAMLPNSTS